METLQLLAPIADLLVLIIGISVGIYLTQDWQ